MKISTSPNNQGCPQTLFLYGTYTEEGEADFGLFCWFTYMSMDNKLGVMCAIGGDKLTKDRILATGQFSANLVTEEMITLADYFGTVPGYDSRKRNVTIPNTKGEVLDVPVVTASPVSFELKVRQHFELNGSDVLFCEIINTLQEEDLHEAKTPEERHQIMKKYAPVCTTYMSYYSFDGNYIDEWHNLSPKIEK